MKTRSYLSIFLFGLLLAGCSTTSTTGSSNIATGPKGTWKCSANGLVEARYSGGEYAYIHLEGFKAGNDYSVQLNSDKTVATGTTSNGTPFTCRQLN